MGAILYFGSFIVIPIAVIWALYKFLDAVSYRIEKHYGICRWASASKYNEPDDYDYSDFWVICFIFATALFFYYR
ncbi:hypothetical protein [uncultured Phascolarctobacterium sp.]|uniref:hypothetical protein n=1 Tax=uncultured Phascolarctobacterium sp. TaxID=512296 RepID=UPI0025DC4DD7|nr:hypothetical protein [uncultured Phascolarctobacterium sp.]